MVRAQGSTVHSESVPDLLIANGPDFAGCSKMILKRKVEGFVSAIPRFESWRPSQKSLNKINMLICSHGLRILLFHVA
jgi:hypothetical protein